MTGSLAYITSPQPRWPKFAKENSFYGLLCNMDEKYNNLRFINQIITTITYRTNVCYSWPFQYGHQLDQQSYGNMKYLIFLKYCTYLHPLAGQLFQYPLALNLREAVAHSRLILRRQISVLEHIINKSHLTEFKSSSATWTSLQLSRVSEFLACKAYTLPLSPSSSSYIYYTSIAIINFSHIGPILQWTGLSQ